MAARELKPYNEEPGEPAPNGWPIALELPVKVLPSGFLASLRNWLSLAPKRKFYYEIERRNYKLDLDAHRLLRDFR